MIRLLGSVALVGLVWFVSACSPQNPLRPSGDSNQDVNIGINITDDHDHPGDGGDGGATNQAPRLISPGDQRDTAGDVVAVTLSAIDPDGDALTWIAGGLPRSLAIDNTGIISGTISSSSSADSPFVATVAVSDGKLSASITFIWIVDP